MLAFLLPLVILAHASPRLIPGGLVTVNYPQVVPIVSGGSCTATYLSRRVLVTAAHCFSLTPWVADSDVLTAHGKTLLEVGGRVETVDIHFISRVNPMRDALSDPPPTERFSMQLYKALDFGRAGFDLALVILPKTSVGQHSMIDLACTAPTIGDAVRFIGFGNFRVVTRNGQPVELNDGQRRIGANRICGMNDQSVHIRGRVFVGQAMVHGNNSTMSGDSGAPLINAFGEAVAVLSGVRPKVFASCDAAPFWPNERISIFERLDRPEVRGWIERKIQENP